MRFPIWSKLSLSSNDGYIHSQKKAARKQIGKIGVSHEKGGRICGSSIPGTLSKSSLTHLILVIFAVLLFYAGGKNGVITEKLYFQAGAGDEEVGGVEVVLLVLLTCLLVLLVLLVVENTGIFTLQ